MALRNDLNAQVKADLTGFSSAIDGQAYILLGENTMGDRTARLYYYQASSVATPDGDSVIDATAMGSIGRFMKIPIEEFNPSVQVNSDWNSVSGVSQILNKPAVPGAPSYNNAPNPTIQTVAAAANGNQLSASKATIVNYSVTVTSATQIGLASNVSGYVVLEICPTNSTTAGDWIEIGRTGNGQNITLAVALGLTTTAPSQVGGVVPAGYYRRLRSINTNGTPTYSYNSGQEVQLY